MLINSSNAYLTFNLFMFSSVLNAFKAQKLIVWHDM